MEKEKSGAHIFLIGFMGAGKSTVAAALKRELGMELVEMDQELVRREGMPIADIFDRYGEDYFRDAESRLVAEFRQREACVVSCGGGIVVRGENVAQMKQCGRIVLLTAKPETIYERVKDSNDRPILNGHMDVGYIAGLMEKRRALYEAAADIVVATDGKDVREICGEIIAAAGGIL